MNALSRKLAHLRCLNRLASAVDAVAAGKDLWLARFKIFTDRDPTALVCFYADHLFEKSFSLGLADRLNDHVAGNLENFKRPVRSLTTKPANTSPILRQNAYRGCLPDKLDTI